MEHERITDIETAEFDSLIEAFIERETKDTGELSAPLFYETLEAIFQEPVDATTVELHRPGWLVQSYNWLYPR